MRHLFEHFCRSAIDWLFRRQSPALMVMRMGLLALTAGAAGCWVLDVSLPWREGQLEINLNSAGGMPASIVYLMEISGFVFLVGGLVWEVHRYRADQRCLSRQKVIVIEGRGLRDASGTPLTEAVPQSLTGHREQVLVDLRQRVRDGFIVEPGAAVERLQSLPADIDRRANGIDRRDISYVYGGLAPVPFTFMTGLLLDDESSITIMDWDRHAEKWRTLDANDDGRRFTVVRLEDLPANPAEVVLAVSVSYRIDAAGVRDTADGIPLVEMILDQGTTDSHWSREKQKALGRQFLETVSALGNLGIERVHLFLAAPNSVVFQFGRLYDKRNLPEVLVYQYQRGASPVYPWAIRMPVSGIWNAEVVQTRLAAGASASAQLNDQEYSGQEKGNHPGTEPGGSR